MIIGRKDREDVKIPKIIMQTWKTNKLPIEWQASQDSISKHMPSWKYVLMTDEKNLKFVAEYFPDFLECYKCFPYNIQRADAIRYMWFYVHGGLYMDLDIEICRPLDELFYKDAEIYTVTSMYMNSVYTNAFMACKSKSSIMLKCLHYMKMTPPSHKSLTKHFLVINTTGPNMFTRAIEDAKYDAQCVNSDIIVEDLPAELILNCNVCNDSTISEPDNPYCRNLGGSSWSGFDTQLLISTYCNREKFYVAIMLIFLIVILVLIYKLKRL